MRRFRYLANLLVPALAAYGLVVGGPATWLAPVTVFIVIVALEIAIRPVGDGPAEDGAATATSWIYETQVLISVPVQVALLLLTFHKISIGAFEGPWLVGAVVSTGLGCGGIGINVGHELGHRRSRFHQLCAKVLLGTSLYAHFFIEHNRGHHVRVATPDDPASARRGESVYAFWWRSVTDGLRSAWDLEKVRLAKLGSGPFTARNELLRLLAVQAAALGAVGAVFGLGAVAAWIVAATIGILLLETVNYVEHYGLQREPTDKGWAPVRPHHSWNSDHPVGRILLFELTRHSDHHAHPTRTYAELRSFPDAPQLPTGYPGMILLALLPPLFRLIMDRRLDSLVRA